MNKTLTGIIGAALLGISSFACDSSEKTEEKISPVLHEKAEVYDAIYVPGRHGSGSSVGPAFGVDGSVGIAVTRVNVTIADTWAIVFSCEHGVKFISQGTDERHKNQYMELSRGDSVYVDYTETFELSYKKNSSGNWELVRTDLVDRDYLGATVFKKASEKNK